MGDSTFDQPERPNSNGNHSRLVIALVATCCLSIGIAIGAIAHGIAGARPEDGRLAMSEAPARTDSLSATFARVAAAVEPAVVHIRVFEGEILPREGTGSGIIVNSTGMVITNHHVVARASKIKVRLFDGREFDGAVTGADPETDLAVVKLDGAGPFPVVRMGDSDKLNVGDWVLAIGSPFGLAQTVTAGIISAKDRVADSRFQSAFQQFLQTDAAINPGNSGGPLVNLSGEVVGINTQIATSTGAYNGVGFALPSATAVEIYNQLATNGKVSRGFLGIRLGDLTPQLARINKIPEDHGVVVEGLTGDDSPAARAGIEAGDVILSINGHPLRDRRDLIRRIASLPVGSDTTVEFVRGGERRTVRVKLDERKDEGQRFELREPFDPRNPRESERKSEPPKRRPVLGLSVTSLSAGMARRVGLEGVRGAYVSAVEPGSIAAENRLRVGDVIIEINYRSITGQDGFNDVLKGLKSGSDVILRILRKEIEGLPRSQIISFTLP